MKINELRKLSRKCDDALSRACSLRNELEKELQKYVDWSTIKVSAETDASLIVESDSEVDVVSISDFIDEIEKNGKMTDIAFGHLSY